MSARFEALAEQRKAAQDAYDAFINPIIEVGEALTEEQETRKAELRAPIDLLDATIAEVRSDEKNIAKIEAERRGIAGANAAANHIEVRESTTYGKGSENSYYMDLAYVAHGVAHPMYEEARTRLAAASHEAAVEMVSNPSLEKRERIRNLVREEKRQGSKDNVRDALKRFEALGQTGRSEVRSGMDTTSGSGGSFATPVYFIGEYAPYRSAGRAFADACNKQELPAYGMTVYLPHVTGPAGVASQSAQNTAVQETDPTAGYLSSNLTTLAGEVTVSQQLLDRAGPGFPFDKMVFDQLNRAYNPQLDNVVLTAALANAGTIAYTDSTGFHLSAANAAGGFYSKVSGGKSAIRKGAGVFMSPSHLFLDPARWEFISAWGDGQARPVVVPDYAGPFNAVAGGSENGDLSIEGNTGYRLNGLPVYTDANIPTPTVGADQALVVAAEEVYYWEGTPVTRALPQTLGNQLSVILQQYSYVAVIPRYTGAVQSIQGTGMATIAF